ncbi:MAG: hypothetical protein HY520_04800 [Candidatus Aenigmarchaeota archaeon]|nr:hypothetical protein [Candidatus Aenigmarchaeota archaeon]
MIGAPAAARASGRGGRERRAGIRKRARLFRHSRAARLANRLTEARMRVDSLTLARGEPGVDRAAYKHGNP